jgi:alpha-mannosidase
MPHRGELGPETVRRAFEFNNPMNLFTSSKTGDEVKTWEPPLVLEGDKNLVLDTIKRAEDDDLAASSKEQPRSVIIRVYDALGGQGRGTVVSKWPLAKVFKTNLLEDEEEEVPVTGGTQFELELGPFQVGSWKLVLV